MFRVLTMEDKCEFLKISIESFTKVLKVITLLYLITIYIDLQIYTFKKVDEEERSKKLLAIKSCKSYSSWPKHTIEELMELMEWRNFSANTSLL